MDNEKCLLIKVHSGLCNRLRAYLSYAILAEFLNRRILLYWNKGPEFSSDSFNDLFENKVECVKDNFYKYVSKANKNINNNINLNDLKNDNNWVIVVEDNRLIWDNLSNKDKGLLSNFWDKFNNLLRSLNPIPKLREKITDISKNFNEYTIGIHIRRGDSILTDYKDNYLASTDSLFIEEMTKRIFKEKRTNFFLSTDCQLTELKFRALFPGKIMTQEKVYVESIPNKEKLGQKEAVIDLFLLSKTKEIIGTNWSSFSWMASVIGNIKLTTPKEKDGTKEGVSIFTVCMNRNKNLESALKSWVNADLIDEIVILDWGSKEPVKEIVDRINDKRIKLLHSNQNKWILSVSFNLAAKFTTRTKLLKLDSDIIINKDFVTNHPICKGIFYTGDWTKARDKNEIHLNGQVFLYREDFFKVNGYSEYIRTYGWDDSELYNRLEKIGLLKTEMNNNYIRHLTHTDEERCKDIMPCIETQKNRILCDKLVWTSNNKMCEFEINEGNVIECKQKNELIPLNEKLVNDSLEEAIKIILTKDYKYSWDKVNKMNLEELKIIIKFLS